MPCIMVGYVLYFLGFMAFYAMVSMSAIGLFPKYCKVTYGDFTSAWVYKDQAYNASTGAVVEGCVTSAMLNPVGNMVTTLNVVMPVVTVGLVLGGFTLRRTNQTSPV